MRCRWRCSPTPLPSRATAGRAWLWPLLALVAGCVPAGTRRGAEPPLIRPDPPGEVAQLPAPLPAWEARGATADARTVAAGDYVVKPGDTLRRIAELTGAGSEAIARANGLAAPFVIHPGQRLVIPAGRYHRVKAGETGIAIARAYGLPWGEVVTANQLAEPYILRTGQRLLIPGDARRPPSRAERAAAFTLDIDDIVTGSEPAIAETQKPARAAPTAARVLPATAAVAAPAALRQGFAWPIDGRVVRGASGVRSDGINIAAPADTPVTAAADGVVAYVGEGVAGMGGLVLLKHGDGWTSVYGHASKLLVQRGQAVKKGQRIALSGDTGYAEQPELHFELRRGRTPVDPLSQLPAR